MANSLPCAGRSLLALSLLCANAMAGTAGDYWIVHGKQERYRHEVFIADAAGILPTPEGVQSAMIMQIFEDPAMPVLTAYEIQYKCQEHKLRLDSARNMRRLDYAFKDATTSRGWIDPQQSAYWLQRSYAFVCAPRNRDHNRMLPLGKMSNAQMVQAVQAMFLEPQDNPSDSTMNPDLDTMLDPVP